MQKPKQKIHCKKCSSGNIAKRGFAKNKLQTLQKYQCKDCKSIFTSEQTKGKTYLLKSILNAVSTYNLGHNLESTKEKINKKYNLNISAKSINNWINQYKSTCTYAKLRKEAINHYTPKTIINKKSLNHIQPYTFRYHNAKLGILLKENPKFTKLKDYIEKINSKQFPHHIFTYNKDKNANRQRASQIKFTHLKIKTTSKNNSACKLASLALNLSTTNKQGHETIQNFFLINDSETIATEIPTYLTNLDAAYYKNKKEFVFPLNDYTTPITGHIDILQIKNNLIHILDYKPDANLKQIQEQAIQQLTIYAMALSKKLNLALSNFKCTWFDENNYYEFFPLHAVYEKQVRMEKMELITAIKLVE
jgi:transposase-like protein|tara:strand:+ start:223 stop:1311 length:1089 start_codon:yes stop_codon:yes gene_type:complete